MRDHTLGGIPAAEPIARLIGELHKLPGIGPKSAQRLAYYLIRIDPAEARALAEAIISVKDQVTLCDICLNITDRIPCRVCNDPQRDRSTICVVEDPLDVLVLERTLTHRGLYHVLHGAISPMNGIGPEDLKLKQLLARLQAPSTQNESGPEEACVKEVILATNPTLEGEATAMYIYRLLSPLGLTITRLARGLPTGAELEYADETTIVRAFQGRQALQL
jgi:recombination protein RecR